MNFIKSCKEDVQNNIFSTKEHKNRDKKTERVDKNAKK